MKKFYLQFTIEELLDDREFIAWMLHGQNQKEWREFLDENPGFEQKADKARKIIELLQERQDHLKEDDILKIWKRIENFDEQTRTPSRQIRTSTLLRYAAMLTFALLIGSAVYWIVDHNQKAYVFSSSNVPSSSDQSQLFLSDGTKVDLEKQNSKIALNADQQVVIENEKVIDLKEKDKEHQTSSKMNEVVIPYGKKSQLQLEDGTRVWLNAGSRLAFPTKFQGKKREVFLEGEAYFEVAHNEKQPFFVHTGEVAIKVLGTRFNISAYLSEQMIETVLVEGKVTVNEVTSLGFLKNETQLTPNHRASYNKTNNTIEVKDEPDVELVIAWTEGWFKFNQQKLNDILTKLERYYNVRFILNSTFPSDELITGKLDLKESIEQVMIALEDVTDIRSRIAGNQIFIEKKTSEIKIKK